MHQQRLGIPSYREPVVLTLIVLMLHKELRLSEIKQTTGVSFERVRMAIQGLINLRIISVVNYFNSDPLFRITDYLAGKSFLEEIALLKVERS
ncbi:MAG: hypothetical protein ACXAD7_04030 [Candidatus Kariarchaeaceae archaeon]